MIIIEYLDPLDSLMPCTRLYPYPLYPRVLLSRSPLALVIASRGWARSSHWYSESQPWNSGEVEMRALEHRHLWAKTEEGGYACEDCDETTGACPNTKQRGRCGRPMETLNRICDKCIARELRLLDRVRTAWHSLDSSVLDVMELGSVDVDATTSGELEEPVQIGAADRYRAQDDFGVLGPMKATPAALKDPENVILLLHERCYDWALRRGEQPSGDVLEWLKRHVVWAVNTLEPGEWDDYRSLVRGSEWQLRRMAGLLPDRNPAPCVNCGGKVVQDRADMNGEPLLRGRSDTLRCVRCAERWSDRLRFDYLNLTTIRKLPETHPDAHLTLEQIRTVLPQARRNTINVALHRDRKRAERRIPPRGEDLRGQPLYRLGDVVRVLQLT